MATAVLNSQLDQGSGHSRSHSKEPPSSSKEEPAKKKIGVEDFDFGKVLGEGSYGDVLLCTEKATGRKFAAKKIEKSHLARTGSNKYALSEREVLVACKHPNIIKLFFSFRDETSLYYILELASKGELRKMIKKHGNFDLASTVFYTAEIVSALEHLHVEQNVIHRDLKPENLLFSSDMHIKMTDFGTAKKLSGRETGARTRSFLGTAEYIAPECLNTEIPEITKASDLWALGCIIYQMLTGKPPFHGDTQFLTFNLVSAGVVEFPPHFPKVAKDIISSLIVLDPHERLGAKDYKDLKSHPFFAGIDFDKLNELTPPEISGCPEYSNFDCFDREPFSSFLSSNDEQIVEYGPVQSVKEGKKNHSGFLLLTSSQIILLNSSMTKVKKSYKLDKTTKIRSSSHADDGFKVVGDFGTLVFNDTSEFEVSRWRKAAKKATKSLP